MSRTHLLLLGIGFGLVVPAASQAQTAYTTRTVNMRAGPSREYPVVDQLQPGEAVEINGCLDDWTWCDVSIGNDRGWVYAGSLESPYRNRRVVIYGNGPMFGYPIVGFSVGPYWDTYYRGRPWYSRRSYWAGRPPSANWGGPSGVRPYVGRPGVVRPQGVRPYVGRPGVVRPQGVRPEVVRPQVVRPQVVRPEVVRPQVVRPQVVRPAPVRPDNRARPPRHEERKPGGN
jgi:uncharacterized protein YraI